MVLLDFIAHSVLTLVLCAIGLVFVCACLWFCGQLWRATFYIEKELWGDHSDEEDDNDSI